MDYKDYGIQLDPQQKAAVTAPIDIPTLVLAGAGSGKTRVLQMRTLYLIDQGLSPERIVVTTFTNKAAKEIKDRVAQLAGKEVVAKLNCGTIHSVCYRMLLDKGLQASIMEDRDKKKIIEDIMNKNYIAIGWKYPVYWINRCKADLIAPAQSREFIFDKLHNTVGLDAFLSGSLADQMSLVYRGYEKEKLNVGFIDFSDMIYLTAKKLRDDEVWKKMLQDKIDAVLIDEAQDTMKLAVNILETLAFPENKVFMCADDMQELYGWNMADVDENVFGFLNRYPNANLYKIETNYRSSRRIVEVSNKLVESQYGEDRKKFKKILRAVSTAKDGANISVIETADVIEEAEVVGSWIQDLITSGHKTEDFYVLYRLNAQSRPIEDRMIKLQIPYVVLGSLGFYDRAVVKDMIAFLFLIEDKTEASNMAYRRIANIASISSDKHYHGFGAAFFEECAGQDPSLWEGMIKIQPFTNWFKKQSIADMVMMFKAFEEQGQHKPAETIRMVRRSAYDNWLIKREGITGEGDEDIYDDLNELEQVAVRFETINDFLAYIIRVRKAKEAQKQTGESGVVTLATVHKVKGLEKPCVALIGVADGILPHWKALKLPTDPKDDLPVDINTKIEDERCIMFVGVTRAREELLITYPLAFRGRPVNRSMFLREMFGDKKIES